MTTAIASFLTAAAVERVRFAEANGGRAGTLYASAEALAAAFGGRARGREDLRGVVLRDPGRTRGGVGVQVERGGGVVARRFRPCRAGVRRALRRCRGFRTERRPHARLAA